MRRWEAIEMRNAKSSTATVRRFFAFSMFTAIALTPVSPAYAQVVGVEVYHYGDIPIPAHVLADVFIEKKVLPNLLLDMSPLWLATKDASQSLDESLDAYFSSSRRDAPEPDLRQNYLRHMLLLLQLRSAIVIYEQISITPDAYSAFLLERGDISVEERTNYLAKAASYVAAGDQPQKAALKAEINIRHEAARKGGWSFFECYFENPRNFNGFMCTMEIHKIDSFFRHNRFKEMFPIDEQTINALKAQFGDRGPPFPSSWKTVNPIDIIGLMLADCDFGRRGPKLERCKQNLNYFSHRISTIEGALARGDDFRQAAQQRLAQIEQDTRVRAENHPLSGFFNNLAAMAAGIIVVTKIGQLKRAEANAANPMWKGHENDLWCAIHFDYDGNGNGREHTYCESYNGMFHGPGIFNRCYRVNGWCGSE